MYWCINAKHKIEHWTVWFVELAKGSIFDRDGNVDFDFCQIFRSDFLLSCLRCWRLNGFDIWRRFVKIRWKYKNKPKDRFARNFVHVNMSRAKNDCPEKKKRIGLNSVRTSSQRLQHKSHSLSSFRCVCRPQRTRRLRLNRPSENESGVYYYYIVVVVVVVLCAHGVHCSVYVNQML